MYVTGEEHIRSINGKYLKPYKPSFNEMAYQHKMFWDKSKYIKAQQSLNKQIQS